MMASDTGYSCTPSGYLEPLKLPLFKRICLHSAYMKTETTINASLKSIKALPCIAS